MQSLIFTFTLLACIHDLINRIDQSGPSAIYFEIDLK